MAKELFDHIHAVIYDKDKKYFDKISEEDKKSFSVFMILKFLSMDYDLTHTMNYLNKFQYSLSKEQMYLFLIELVPSKKYNLKYLKNKSKKGDKNIIEIISYLFNVSEQKSYEYLNILTDEEINLLESSLNK